MENKSEFWADVSAVVVTPVAIAAGLAKGTYDASTDNGAFIEGFTGAATPIIQGRKELRCGAWLDHHQGSGDRRRRRARRPHPAHRPARPEILSEGPGYGQDAVTVMLVIWASGMVTEDWLPCGLSRSWPRLAPRGVPQVVTRPWTTVR